MNACDIEVLMYSITVYLYYFLNFRGNVIGPTFYFDTKQLKFETISYGMVFSICVGF